MKEVYKVRCWYDGDEVTTNRYVVADSEEEVTQKMDKYVEKLKSKGCATLHYLEGCYTVEIDNVIV